jgi:hypothetical protein
MMLSTVVLLVTSRMESAAAATATCATDCNASCPARWIKIGPLKTKYRDPSCKGSCEAGKKVSCALNVPVTVPNGVLEDVQKGMDQRCAAGFEVFTKSVILTGPIGNTQADSQRFENLKSALTKAGVVSEAQFRNIQIKYRNLKVKELGIHPGGLTPDRNVIFLASDLRNASEYEQAATLAHEMKHVAQYRDMGTDSFKCNYTKHLLACRCQDRRHEMERDAYEFEDAAREKLAVYWGEDSSRFLRAADLRDTDGSTPSRALLGTWKIQTDRKCKKNTKEFGYVYQRSDGVLIAVNECGDKSTLSITRKSVLVASKWGYRGTVDAETGAIAWKRGKSSEHWSR